MNARQLQEMLSERRPESEGRQSWTHELEGWTVHLTADRHDTLASLLWEVALSRGGPVPAHFKLHTWADRVAAGAEGLLENLKVVEVDGTRGEAQLRSDEPSRRGPLAAYYELTLHAGRRAVLRRWQADTAEGTRRVQTSFTLTHEVLARLASVIAE